jgi:CheY-like chemotaxis protein
MNVCQGNLEDKEYLKQITHKESYVREDGLRTILLVEDSASDVELTRRALSKSRIEVSIDVAEDGVEALDYLFCEGVYSYRNQHPLPDLILLDLNIPKIDGNEVLKRIRANDKTKLIPIVILTSSNEDSDLLKAYNAGANSYIRKPVDFNQFAEVVNHLGRYWLQINEPPPK